MSALHIAYHIGSTGEENVLVTCCDSSTRILICGGNGKWINYTYELCSPAVNPTVESKGIKTYFNLDVCVTIKDNWILITIKKC